LIIYIIRSVHESAYSVRLKLRLIYVIDVQNSLIRTTL